MNVEGGGRAAAAGIQVDDPRLTAAPPPASGKTEFRRLVQTQMGIADPARAPLGRGLAGANSAQRYALPTIMVREGDTLSGIARRALESRGLEAGRNATARAVGVLAQSNQLANPDLIVPGQVIDLAALGGDDNFRMLQSAMAQGGPAAAPDGPPQRTPETASQVLQARANAIPRGVAAGRAQPLVQSLVQSPGRPHARLLAQQSTPAAAHAPAHPILEKTLRRAVSLGYVSPGDVDAVRDKILDLSRKHRFRPDDLAIVTLMESDGMNPKASNGRCHGLIQFCDGPNRGAASVGYREDPRSITQLGVLDQLELVGRYFEETGLKTFGRTQQASLDDLYLTVLTPAARRERASERELDIPGPQAAPLHVGNDPAAPITRKSLLQGLRQVARDKLALFGGGTARAEPVKVSVATPEEQTLLR